MPVKVGGVQGYTAFERPRNAPNTPALAVEHGLRRLEEVEVVRFDGRHRYDAPLAFESLGAPPRHVGGPRKSARLSASARGAFAAVA